MLDSLSFLPDTVLLVGTVAQFLLGAVCFCAVRSFMRRLPLYWLASYGLLGGLACCLELWAYSAIESPVAMTLRAILYIGAMVCLVEFWAAMHVRKGGRRGQGVWFFALLLVVYSAAFALGSEAPLNIAGRVFGVLSGALAAWVLLREAQREARGRLLLLVASLAVMLAAVSGVVTACGLALQPVGQALRGQGLASVFVFWMLLRAAAVTLLAGALWHYGVELSEPILRRRLRRALLFVPLLVVIVLAGFVAADQAGKDYDAHLRADLLTRTRIAAGVLDARRVLELAQGGGQPGDADSRIQGKLLDGLVRADPAVFAAFLYVPRGDGVALLASAPEGASGRAAARLQEPVAEQGALRAFLDSGSGMVDGPLSNEWGAFATAHQAVSQVPGGGRVFAALGLAFDAEEWERAVARERLYALRQALLGAVLVLAFFVALQMVQAQVWQTEESEHKYRSLFHSMQEGVAYCRILNDARGRPEDFLFLDVNPAAEKLTGISRQQFLGRTVLELFPGRQEKLYRWIDFMGGVARTQHTRSAEMFYPPLGVWFSVRSFSWEPGYFAMTITDITRRREVEEEQRRQALHDPLTDLPNRRLFQDRLEQALVQADRTGNSCAVFYLDLNDFKQVNDSLGHEFGDKILREVANRFKGCIRRADTLARIGGDEFTAVIACGDGEDTVKAIAVKMQAAVAEPFRVDGHMVNLGVSIGVSLYPRHGADAATILARADAAMYRGKGDKTLDFVLYSE